MIRPLACALALACALTPTTALATPPPTATLAVERRHDTAACDDARALAARVAALLGRPAIVEQRADLAISVRTERRGATWVARIRLTEHATTGPGRASERLLRAPRRTCAALDETVALAIAIALDPLASLTPPDEAAQPREADPQPTPRIHRAPELESRVPLVRAPIAILVSDTSHAAAPRVTAWALFAGLEARLGFAPEVSLGPRLGIAFTSQPIILTSTVSFHTSSVTTLGPRPVAISAPSLALGACLDVSPSPCLGLEAAAYSATESTTDTSSEHRLHLAATASLWFPASPSLRLGATLHIPFGHQRLGRDGEALWTMPPAFVGLALELVHPAAVSLGPAPASAEASGAASRAPTASAAALRGPSLPFPPDG